MTTAAPGSLRKRVLRGSAFELGGYGAQQVMRLGSNLILTRLLFPEAFGLSTLVSILIMGLVLLSDVGVQQFLIQSPRGEEPTFVNTAFTFQAVRGCVLAFIMVVLAYPAAWFYKEPQLAPLICFGSLQLVFGGLHSTSVYTLRRRLALGWITALELGQSVLSLVIMIPWAWARPGVWPLVGGGVAASLAYAIATHFLPVPYRNRFAWDKAAYQEISHFGRWIFGSTAVGFLGGQSDRILLGRFLGAGWLGIYSVALNLSEAVSAVIGRLIGGIVYPVLSQAAREPGSDMSAMYYRVRLRLDALSMTGTGLLVGMGGWVITTLWDDRYTDAAWILRILCVRVAVSCIVGPGETCLFSLGHTRYGFWRSVSRLVSTLVGIPLGWHFGGVVGVIWASVLAEVPAFFIVWPKLRSLKILRLRRELLSVGIFLAAMGVGLAILPWLPRIHVRH
ncbi:MAG: oligosaccharide flippase family protein [Deltaproteobacteria bacterium]|nr:oligosaccharide flippase family protein [Deltaproteobacteria bacterium]